MNLSRRLLLRRTCSAAVALGVALSVAPEADAGKLKMRGRGGGGPATSFLVNGSGFGDTYFSDAPPVVADTTRLYRSYQPTADEADIGLAEECGPYRSPPATQWLVTGPDVADFQASLTYDGFIRYTTACRTGGVRKVRTLYLTPYRAGVGWGPTGILEVAMAATAGDEFFLSETLGVNSGVKGTLAAPYKYLPGSADYAGTARAPFTSDQVVFWSGERHYTTACASKTNILSLGLSHGGTAGHLCAMEFNGWGAGPTGRAILDGSQPASGSPATVTQAQVAGNASFGSIRRLSSQTYIEGWQLQYQGSSQFYEGGWPTPADIRYNRGVDYVNAVGSEQYGTRNYPVQFTGGTRRMYTNHATDPGGWDQTATKLYVVEPDWITLFAGLSSAQIAATGMTAICRNYPNNFWVGATFSSWDSATGTMEFNFTTGISSSDGFGSFSLRNHPLFITKAGQTYIDPTRTQMDYWPYSGAQVYISRLLNAIPWRSGDYIVWRGGGFERFCNGQYSATTGGYNANSGTVYWYGSSGTTTQAHLVNGWYKQNNSSDGGQGIIHLAGGTAAGLIDSNIVLNYFEECNNGSGIRFGAAFQGTQGTSGVEAAIRAGLYGKIAYNSMGDNALGQTWMYLSTGEGVHIHHNIVIHHKSIHGNGYTLIDATSSAYNLHILLELNIHMDGCRFITFGTSYTGDKHLIIRKNIVAQPGRQGAAIQANGTGDGVRIQSNLILGYDSSYAEPFAIQFGAGGANMDISGNVCAGISTSAYFTGAWVAAVHDNDNTVNGAYHDPGTSTSGGTYTNNKQYTGSPDALRPYWDGTFTANDKARLGLGAIGAFHNIAA